MNRVLYVVTIDPSLAICRNAAEKILGDPHLSAYGAHTIGKLWTPLKARLPEGPSQIHFGTGRRFRQAAEVIFPNAELIFFSPLWGEALYEMLIGGQKFVVLGDGKVYHRKRFYDRLPPIENNQELELLADATWTAAFNLPDNAVIFTERRALLLLGLSPRQYHKGTLYLVESTSSNKPSRFTILADPKSPLAQAA